MQATHFSKSNTQKNTEALKPIVLIDHVTYVSLSDHESIFLSDWKTLEFAELERLNTKRFPATHIALISSDTGAFPWVMMSGLSVSQDDHSPINEFISRYGEGVQHTAYRVDTNYPMEDLYNQMKAAGWNFMTPVLTHQDASGARLKQMFTAPGAPYGTFIEFIQRLPGADGSEFDTFDITNIDDLYQHYDDYSLWMTKSPKTVSAR